MLSITNLPSFYPKLLPLVQNLSQNSSEVSNQLILLFWTITSRIMLQNLPSGIELFSEHKIIKHKAVLPASVKYSKVKPCQYRMGHR